LSEGDTTEKGDETPNIPTSPKQGYSPNKIPSQITTPKVKSSPSRHDKDTEKEEEEEPFMDASNTSKGSPSGSPARPQQEDGNKSTRSLRDRSALQPPDRYRTTYTLKTPTCYEEALDSPEQEQWKGAMLQEYQSLMQHETWELVDVPTNTKIFEPTWIFKVIEDSKGNPIKYKAR